MGPRKGNAKRRKFPGIGSARAAFSAGFAFYPVYIVSDKAQFHGTPKPGGLGGGVISIESFEIQFQRPAVDRRQVG